MIVLGLDPGLAAMGYGVISSVRKGYEGFVRSEFGMVDMGTIRTKKDPKLKVAEDLSIRVRKVSLAVHHLIDEFEPHEAAIEIFGYWSGDRGSSSIQLANVYGMLCELLTARKVPFREYSVQEIKMTVTGDRRGDKEQIKKMVRLELGMDRNPSSSHAGDALAVAITHVATRKFREAVEAAGANG